MASRKSQSLSKAAPRAIIPPSEEILVASTRVACDGGGGALGHPLVYLDVGPAGVVECGYCDRRFVLAADPHSAHYHDPSARAEEAH